VDKQSADRPPPQSQTDGTPGSSPQNDISLADSEGEGHGQTVTGAGEATNALSQATTNDNDEMEETDLSDDEKDLHE